MFSKLPAVLGAVSLSMVAAACLAQPAGSVEVNAQSITVSGIGHQGTFPCEGRKLVVEGTDHVVTATGVCSQVEVSGTTNKVDVAIAPKGKLEVAGTDHVVRWKSTGEPRREVSGIDNKIIRVK